MLSVQQIHFFVLLCLAILVNLNNFFPTIFFTICSDSFGKKNLETFHLRKRAEQTKEKKQTNSVNFNKKISLLLFIEYRLIFSNGSFHFIEVYISISRL